MTQEEYIEKFGEQEGLRRWKRSEYDRQYYETNKEKVKEIHHRYYETNKEKMNEKNRQYRKAHPEKQREWQRRYCEANPEKQRENIRRWRAEHPMECRANRLLQAYRQSDCKSHRGECTLTKQWVLDNILTGHCIYCGETDWHLLGCDRKNNTRPHTPDNVVCCCRDCNKKRGRMDIITYALSIGAVESEGLTIQVVCP